MKVIQFSNPLYSNDIYASQASEPRISDIPCGVVKSFVLTHLDLMFRGDVNVADFLVHVFQVFCLSKQTVLKIRLPKLVSSSKHTKIDECDILFYRPVCFFLLWHS